MRLALCVALAACGASGAKPLAAPPPPPAAGKHLAMGDFDLDLPGTSWRGSNIARDLVGMPAAAGLDEDGGAFALFDEPRDLFVHGFDGASAAGRADPGAIADAVHRGADDTFTARWQVTRRERRDVAGERRHSLAGDDSQGLSMEALVVTRVAADGAVRGAGVQCVWKKAAPEGAATCRRILDSLRIRSPSSAAPAARSS